MNSKMLEFEKIHTDDNGSDMMTKMVTKDKLNVCCQVAGLVIPSM